jgi:hypothetical protein
VSGLEGDGLPMPFLAVAAGRLSKRSGRMHFLPILLLEGVRMGCSGLDSGREVSRWGNGGFRWSLGRGQPADAPKTNIDRAWAPNGISGSIGYVP